MLKNMSAEQKAEMQGNSADDDSQLTQQNKPSASPNSPHLRIVHSSDRPQTSSPADTPPAHGDQAIDRPIDRPPAMLDRVVQAQIGRMLRDVFSGVADEPVPERFVTLLAELAAKEKSR